MGTDIILTRKICVSCGWVFHSNDNDRRCGYCVSAHEIATNVLSRIKGLQDAGIIGRELCPEPDYWHWPILKPEEVPDNLRQFVVGNEIRW